MTTPNNQPGPDRAPSGWNKGYGTPPPNNQPTPPPGYRLPRDDERDKPLPNDVLFFNSVDGWSPSVMGGLIPYETTVYAIPITPTVPATGDTTNEKGGGQELLPCPFCGSRKIIREYVRGTGCNTIFHRCGDCNAEGPWSNLSNLFEKWNTRK